MSTVNLSMSSTERENLRVAGQITARDVKIFALFGVSWRATCGVEVLRTVLDLYFDLALQECCAAYTHERVPQIVTSSDSTVKLELKTKRIPFNVCKTGGFMDRAQRAKELTDAALQSVFSEKMREIGEKVERADF